MFKKILILGLAFTLFKPTFLLAEAVTSIDLRLKNLKVVPLKVFSNPDVQSLELTSNPITDIPPQIKQLKKLRKLDIACTNIKSLPLELAQIPLEELSMGGRMDCENGKLMHLSKKMIQIISSISTLKSLTLINMTGLGAFPVEFGKLKQLETLAIDGTDLAWVGPSIAHLKNLKKIEFVGNRLRNLPNEVQLLHNLKTLDLGNGAWIPRETDPANHFSNNEREKIKKLLPNTQIIY